MRVRTRSSFEPWKTTARREGEKRSTSLAQFPMVDLGAMTMCFPESLRKCLIQPNSEIVCSVLPSPYTRAPHNNRKKRRVSGVSLHKYIENLSISTTSFFTISSARIPLIPFSQRVIILQEREGTTCYIIIIITIIIIIIKYYNNYYYYYYKLI